jgi:hypothetical protein
VDVSIVNMLGAWLGRSVGWGMADAWEGARELWWWAGRGWDAIVHRPRPRPRRYPSLYWQLEVDEIRELRLRYERESLLRSHPRYYYAFCPCAQCEPIEKHKAKIH